MRGIKEIRQDEADNKAEIAKYEAQANVLLDVAAAERTPEQTAKLAEVRGKLKALDTLKAAIAEDLATANRLADVERKSGTAVVPGIDHATERPWGPPIPATASVAEREQMLQAEFGTFLNAVYQASKPGGSVDPRLFAAISGASTSVPSDGGHLVRIDWNTMLLNKAMEQAVIAPKCGSVPVGEDSDGVELPYVSETSRATGSRWGGVQVYRAAEAATVTASKPQLETMEIRLADLMGIMYATERLMRDASAFGSIATKAFSSEFAFKLDDEIVRGSGVGQCKGLLNSLTTATPAGAVISVTKDTNQVAATFTNTNISNMWVRLLPRSKANAVWFINHELGPQLDVLSIPAGTAALEPRFVSYGPDGILRIKGRPVIEVEQCAALGTVGDVILADMSDYLLISKGGLNQAESMHVRFLYNERTFRWTRSVNGAPATRSALTPYKGTATLSPYVVLATRA